jgi:hypothetical protein
MANSDESKRQIEKIMAEIECPFEFQCYQSDSPDICSAKDIGLPDFILCCEEVPHECQFSIPFGHQHLCKCPLKIYLAKNDKDKAGRG